MKTLITEYSFDASAKQITFTDTSLSIVLEQVLLITNVTDNVIIYNFADPSAGGTLSNNVLTLGYDTTAMADNDKLQIFIDVDESDFQEGLMALMRLLTKSTAYARDNADRMRVVMDNNPMLYVYTRNSGAPLNAGTEAFYSPGCWNVVDAREQLASIQNNVVSSAMQRWRVM